MSETTQGYLGIDGEIAKVNLGFQSVLNHIRARARSEYRKGELFEQLMQKYFTEDPDYKDQFSEVYLWKEWAELQTDFDGRDIGVDLVAQKTRRRILCHPVQMLCPGYPNLKRSSEFIPCHSFPTAFCRQPPNPREYGR